MAQDKVDGRRGDLCQKIDIVIIDWTGTYIITYNTIFGMKKGWTWVTRQGGGGVQPPQASPWIRL